MAFMKPEYYVGSYVSVEMHSGETYLVPSDEFYLGDVDWDQTYAVDRFDRGVLARLSAPGYLDCTEWTLHGSIEEAREYIESTYDVDPDTCDERDEREEGGADASTLC